MSWLITGSEKVAQDLYLYTNTVLLLHGDGTNGSTTIVDSSKVAGSPNTVTAVGNAQISTAQSKFGGASIAFDGTGDYLTLSSNSAFGFSTADFTWEAWVYIAGAQGTDRAFIDVRPSAAAVGVFYISNTNKLAFFGNPVIGNTGASLAISTWYHVALVRASGLWGCYLDGISQWTSSQAFTFPNAPSMTIGAGQAAAVGAGATPFNGYIDDLRITNGVARYTANFTPPTAPFPDI